MNDFHSQRRALSPRDDRLLRRILSGRADANIRFAELRRLLRNMGFSERVRGSHYVFGGPGIIRPLTIQPTGSMAKPYQVQQIRAFIKRHFPNDAQI